MVAARLPLEDSDTEDSVISSNALSRFDEILLVLTSLYVINQWQGEL